MINFDKIDGQLYFDESVFPSVILNQGNFETVEATNQWIKQHKIELEAELSNTGALLFRGFPINSAETFDAFSSAFGYPSFTYKESLSNAVRINFTERVFTANEAPKDVEIYLHHEMAQTPISPEKLFFFCNSAADEGGATPICRSDQLFKALESELPELAKQFENKGLRYITHMPSKDDAQSGQGRSWASTLSVETKQQAEKKLAELAYDWHWQDDGSLKAITPILPAVLTLENGKKVFYNQLVAAYMGWAGVREDPSRALAFGDGSAIPKAGLERIAALSENYTFDIQWQDGDVALLDNKITMHGRRPYSGERKRQVLVALAA
ncbi:MAG: alpha-ketoglutarate-dependent taurine dioxygenase [Arenicella sp.]|jgi:alpha-ketoglutarate-dependent taurine dioxygenase